MLPAKIIEDDKRKCKIKNNNDKLCQLQLILTSRTSPVLSMVPDAPPTSTKIGTYYHRTTFLQFRLASSILPQSPYFFHLYFLFRCSLDNYEFGEISYCTEKLKCGDIPC